MASGRRPRLSVRPKIIYIKLRLYADLDDDLVAFFDRIPEGLRASMVKEALRFGSTEERGKEDRIEDDLLDALDSLVEG